MTDIARQISELRERVDRSLLSINSRRPPPLILAVSKTHTIQAIESAHRAGLHHFGENYLQEAVAKIQQLSKLDLTWHYIGKIQANKTNLIANHFHWVHTLERVKIAQRLSQQRSDEMPPLNLCIQVNIDQEEQKGGVQLNEIPELLDAVSALPKLNLRGLMAIPKRDHNLEARAKSYLKLAETLNTLKVNMPHLDTLSMGMSADLETAIQCGATIIRVGSAIFGPRENA